MDLNLTMVAGGLTNLTILSQKMARLSRRQLKFPVHYTGETTFLPDRLYLAKAEDLTPHPHFDGLIALISIGYPPSAYHHDQVELLCLSSDTPALTVLNALQVIFSNYQTVERDMFELLQTDNCYEKMGQLAFRLFKNPVTALDAHEKILFFEHDPNQTDQNLSYENQTKPGEFISEDERRILQLDPQFLATYATIGPSLDEKRIYRTNGLYINLREDKIYCGRLLVEDAYKNFEDFEYPLLEWFGEFVKKVLLTSSNPRFGDSTEVEEMMRQLLLFRMPYQPEYDRLLKGLGWEKDDTYFCVCIASVHGCHPKTPLLDAATYFNELFDSHYILLNEPRLIQVFNLTRSQYNQEQFFRRLDLFLQNDNLIAGIGVTITAFTELRNALQQAMYALDFQKKLNHSRMVKFVDCVLSLLIENARGSHSGDFYCTDAIQKLMDYDRLNNGELLKTLKCYVENNMSASKTQEILHIARTTCLYRINRILEISDLNLNDPDIRLYLLLLFRLIDPEQLPSNDPY